MRTSTGINREMHKSTLLLLILSSVYLPNFESDALSFGRPQKTRKPATAASQSPLGSVDGTDITVIGEYLFEEESHEPSSVFLPQSFPSPSTQYDAVYRPRRHFRRGGRRDFQLNYKDVDDNDLNAEIERQKLHQRITSKLGSLRRSKNKTPSEDFVSIQSDVADVSMQSAEAKGIIELSEPTMPNVGKSNNRKKKPQAVVTNVQELREAILDRGLELRDLDLQYAPPPSLLSSKKNHSTDSDVKIVTLESSGADVEGIDDDPNNREWQLIGNVLAEDEPLSDNNTNNGIAQVNGIFTHDVLNLLQQRYHTHSTPMSRAKNDTATLALAIEGGGMRGAISGGMAAAICCLGLSNAFDSVYGSSAGSIIGSYFVSRQLYLDVYTDVIPAGKDYFVSKAKIISDIFRNMFLSLRGPLGKKLNSKLVERFRTPSTDTNVTTLPPTREGGLNISFVLDSIMCPERGLRPLDLETFAHNDARQSLRIVSSSVELETGMLKSVCFGAKEGYFRDEYANHNADHRQTSSDSLYPEINSAQADENGYRRGIWACLGASMSVPGAAGNPFRMDLPSSLNANETSPHLCFDAFCYEPVPFRSAVAEGATHVLALRSRPAGFEPKTKPTLYERAVAPLYFRSNGEECHPVAEFFERGGQQYLYAEDVLTCDQGLNAEGPIPIPPAGVLYANPGGSKLEKDRSKWKHAHLLPITVPADVPELSTLSQDRDDILAGIRSGFAAAYDALAPVVGLEIGPDMDGMRVAELVFPAADVPHESFLDEQFELPGEKLGKIGVSPMRSLETTLQHNSESLSSDDDTSSFSRRRAARLRRWITSRRALQRFKREVAEETDTDTVATSQPVVKRSDVIFSLLPGVQLGSLPMVAERIQMYLESHSFLDGEL